MEKELVQVRQVIKDMILADARIDGITDFTIDGVIREEIIPLIEKEVAGEIFKAYNPYIKGLEDENGSLVGFACTHGWSSSRVEFGKKCRKKIKALKEKYCGNLTGKGEGK